MVFWRATRTGMKQFEPFVRRVSADASKFTENSGEHLKEVGAVLRHIGSNVREFAETNSKMDDIFALCILGSMAWSASKL